MSLNDFQTKRNDFQIPRNEIKAVRDNEVKSGSLGDGAGRSSETRRAGQKAEAPTPSGCGANGAVMPTYNKACPLSF